MPVAALRASCEAGSCMLQTRVLVVESLLLLQPADVSA